MSGLRDLLAAATPAPWLVSVAPDYDQGVEYRHVHFGEHGDDEVGYYLLPADARLIALAPDLAQLACDMGDALRAYVNAHSAGCDAALFTKGACTCEASTVRALLARLDSLHTGADA